MGVYIKDMDMPTSCDDCYIANCPNDIGYTDTGKRSRHINCSLIEVPNQHGRLIEKNAVFKLIQSMPSVDRLLPVEFMKALQEIQTIIPAEEEDE